MVFYSPPDIGCILITPKNRCFFYSRRSPLFYVSTRVTAILYFTTDNVRFSLLPKWVFLFTNRRLYPIHTKSVFYLSPDNNCFYFSQTNTVFHLFLTKRQLFSFNEYLPFIYFFPDNGCFSFLSRQHLFFISSQRTVVFSFLSYFSA